MTNRLYAWDEIGDEIAERDPEELHNLSCETGFIETGSYEFLPGRFVMVMETDRHVGLHGWFVNIAEARAAFQLNERYRNMEAEGA